MRAELAFYLVFPATLLAVELMLRLRFREVLARWVSALRQSVTRKQNRPPEKITAPLPIASPLAEILANTLKLIAITLIAFIVFATIIGLGVSGFRFDTSLPETIFRSDVRMAAVIIAAVWVWGRRFIFR